MRRPLLVPILAILLLLAVAVPAQAVDLSGYRRPPLPQRVTVPEGAHLVRYVVNTSRGGTLTYMVGGATSQRDADPGERYVLFAAYPGDFLYMSVQNAGDRGEVSCAIYVDRQLVQQAESDAAYGIASCQAQTPN
jgi:hypothetical protein